LKVFADTSYWIALVLPGDQWAGAVGRLEPLIAKVPMVTTDEVLTELLAALSGKGARSRQMAAAFVRSVLANPRVTVVHQSHGSFLEGLTLYERRLDKGYSLVDCISMNVMRKMRIRQALTNDRHFAQEGFTVLR